MAVRLSHFVKHPKDIGGLLIVAFAWSLAKLPLSAQLTLANWLGKLFYRCFKSRVRVARINLEICFPEKSAQERELILKDNFRQTALALIEVAACWFSDLTNRKQYSQLSGIEHLQSAQANGNGVILLIFHFTSMELGGCLMGEYFDFNAMYKPAKNNLVEKIMCSGRLRHIHQLITQNDAKAAVRALKRNEVVWYSTDQNYGNKSGVFAPFFGKSASAITGLSRLAKLTGAAVVPCTHERINQDRGLKITLHPALDNFPTQSPIEDATRVNEFLEKHLNKLPNNYFWVHQRFRSRPEGESPVY